MIYLIGGSARCGKTILSKKIAIKKRTSLISTDHLRSMVLAMVPKSEMNKKFPQTKMVSPKNKFRFDCHSAEAMLKAQVIEAKTMWPPIKALISSLIYRDQDCVIEGVHLFPSLVKQLKGTKDWKHIKVVYLIKTDLEKIQIGFSKNKEEFDWMYPFIKNDADRLRKAAKMVSVKGAYIEKEAGKYNLKVYNTENNFNKVLKEARSYLINE